MCHVYFLFTFTDHFKSKTGLLSPSSIAFKHKVMVRAGRLKPQELASMQHNFQMSKNKPGIGGEKTPYTCNVCNKGFTQQQHYVGHVNVHYGVRPFKCPHCSKGFSYKSSLACHRKRCVVVSKAKNLSGVRGLKQQYSRMKQCFKCDCGMEFGTQEPFLFHQNTCAKIHKPS